MPDPTQPICEFAFPGPLRDRLVAAVLGAQKTATSSLLIEWELEGAAFPPQGEHQTVIDSDGCEVGVIEILKVDVIALGDADMELAVAEGESFESVQQWRIEHERFWNDEVFPTLPREAVVPLTDDTKVVVEWFRLVSR